MKRPYLLIFMMLALACACTKSSSEEDPVDPEPEVIPEPTKGEHDYLVVLVESSDVHFSIDNPQQSFWDMLNKEGYSDYGGTGSARDYFMDQSCDTYFPNFDVAGPVRVDMAMSNFTKNYGLTSLGAARLFAMACDILDSEIDFSKYDSDDDGVIDSIFFYYAGYNSAEGPDDAIFPHAGTVEYKKWTFDGVELKEYACTSELKGSEGTVMARIGNFCHEFAHTLGLPDFYDTASGKADGLGDFSLMHSGCYNNDGNTPPSLNCEERMLLGWMDDMQELPSSGNVSLGPISGNTAYRAETDNEGEYYCYEFRNGEGWDAYIPKGLVIYHVDKSQNVVNGKTAAYRWKYQYDINGYAAHECFDLMEASDTCTVFGTGINEFTPVAWSENVQNYYLEDISANGESAYFKVTERAL